jgi:DNA-binding CsgD family transcriptional regulator
MTGAIADAKTELHSGASGAPVVAGAHASTPESTALIEDLSPREIEVLRFLVNGKTDQQIAEILFISRRTVATHLNHIYGKLGISSRAAAAAFAVRHGLA